MFSFDIPTYVGGFTILPGTLLSWNGAVVTIFDFQPAWPANRSSRVNALTFDPLSVGLR